MAITASDQRIKLRERTVRCKSDLLVLIRPPIQARSKVLGSESSQLHLPDYATAGLISAIHPAPTLLMAFPKTALHNATPLESEHLLMTMILIG